MSIATTTANPRLRDCERMLRAVCPVLAEQPLYLVDHRTAPELEIPECIGGWAGWRAPFAVQPFVDWQGPGFATVLRLESIHPDDLTAVVLHELCHWLPMAFLVDMASRVDDFHGAGEAGRATDFAGMLPERQPKPWEGHGPDFVRLFLHATWRASQAGFRIHTGAGFDWFRYRVPMLKRWKQVLGDEPQRLRGLALQDIAAEPAPAAYRQFSDHWLTEAEARFTGANTWD